MDTTPLSNRARIVKAREAKAACKLIGTALGRIRHAYGQAELYPDSEAVHRYLAQAQQEFRDAHRIYAQAIDGLMDDL